MKTKSILPFLLIFLSACTVYNKILVVDDEFKEEKSIKLLQVLDGYSDEMKSFVSDIDYFFNTKLTYNQHQNSNEKVSLEIKLTTNAQPEELDSILYIGIDDEKIKLASNNYAMRNYVNSSTSTETTTTVEEKENKNNSSEKKEKETSSSTSTSTTTTDRTLQVMKHTFYIPKSEWEKLAQFENIILRTYIENEGINVKFSFHEKTQFKQFFREVLKMENTTTSFSL